MAGKIRDLSRPLDTDCDDPIDDIAKGPPRATAIVATALLEDALRWCLAGYLIPAGSDRGQLPEEDQSAVFDNEIAPLNTFHAKIVIGYSLGIYGKITRDDLNRIKRIRNQFAHSFRPITFRTPEIAKECLELCYIDHFNAINRVEKTAERTQAARDPRQNFIKTADLLEYHLQIVEFPRKYTRKAVMGKMP
jgi:hypothetical protein